MPMKSIIVILLLLMTLPLFSQIASSNPQEEKKSLIDQNAFEDELTQAYRIFKKSGSYEDKKSVLDTYKKNYQNPRVVDMIVDLLTYSYNNPAFREDNQEQYYDDVIAGELIKILGKNGSPKGVPALLKITLYNRNHRDLTVQDAWKALMSIKW